MPLILANSVAEWFVRGGPVMWPLLALALALVAVIVERWVFWIKMRSRRDGQRLLKVLSLMEGFEFAEATALASQSNDPVLRTIHSGLSHAHGSLQGAIQMAAGLELKRAGRFMVLIDTCITMAPLLGLLGTVTGIMKSFSEVVGELAVQGVTAGIGEALIATACGLGIALCGVFFLNFFNELIEELRFDLETAATNVEVMVTRARQEGVSPAGWGRPSSTAEGAV
ncbi:MAG TPA: MotA/TolQ/ExbB proton channel family protein [Candidatus Limnocylindria bacterium]|jgi:biopolymer transport protein ExbB|nr:MotA/TolQ/ExbB proton channel family protein [Candidatus Limnocylindria bacterium]